MIRTFAFLLLSFYTINASGALIDMGLHTKDDYGNYWLDFSITLGQSKNSIRERITNGDLQNYRFAQASEWGELLISAGMPEVRSDSVSIDIMKHIEDLTDLMTCTVCVSKGERFGIIAYTEADSGSFSRGTGLAHYYTISNEVKAQLFHGSGGQVRSSDYWYIAGALISKSAITVSSPLLFFYL